MVYNVYFIDLPRKTKQEQSSFKLCGWWKLSLFFFTTNQGSKRFALVKQGQAAHSRGEERLANKEQDRQTNSPIQTNKRTYNRTDRIIKRKSGI